MTQFSRRLAILLGTAAPLLPFAAPAQAQEQPAGVEQPAVDDDIIVVTATPIRGMVISDIPPEVEFDEQDVASYGAGSIEELLEAIAPQTGSARGRGSGGRPVILLNGQRVSGFRELRDLPPEAIERVQVFPEELALQYGYRPDQRVVNFILKRNFAAITGEVEHGMSTAGGFGATEIEATLTRIGEKGRLNVDVEYEADSQLLESERGIIQPEREDLGLYDNGDYRTLLPETDRLEINASYSRTLTATTSLTLSGEFTHEDSRALLGLPGTTLVVPATSPFARNPDDETLFRFLPAAGGTLARDSSSSNAEAGLTLNGQLGEWRWSFTGNYARDASTTITEREPDFGGLAARIAAGDPTLNPFAPDLGAGLGFTRDRAESVSQNADANANIAGSPLYLPGGEVNLSVTTGFEWRAIDSEAVRSGAVSSADLSRERLFARANVDVPITSRREGFLDAIGDVSLNANAGYSDLSDFGGLVEYGYGLNWEPLGGLSLLASVIVEEAAPSIQQLGDPVIVTPNVSVYDFTRGETVLVDRITGGNPALAAEERRDFKFSVNYAPGDSRDVRFIAEYIRNRSEDVTSAFPLLTPEIEAAFPDRIVRDPAGNLVSIDARPVTFAELRSERIRYGVNLSGEIGGDDEEEAGRAGGEGRGRRGGQGDAGPGGGGPPSPMAFMRRGGGGGRWQLSAYHTWRLEETAVIRPGLPELDLLEGSVIGGSSPAARHSVELEGGVFLGGLGLRVEGQYLGRARVSGSGLPGSNDLFFDDLFTMDARLFVNFDSRPGIVEAVPFLEGSRLSLRVDNIFGGIQRITDGGGEVPISYQPGFVDARGRYVELSFRKRF